MGLAESIERNSHRVADFLGTPKFLVIQTLAVLGWVTVNLLAWAFRFDPYPFILLNLAFSTQAAYAAPLILMAGKATEQRNNEYLSDVHEDVKAIRTHLEGL